MVEYIEREAALLMLMPIVKRSAERNRNIYSAVRQCVDAINSCPAADVRPVVLCRDCVYSDKWYKDRLICYLWNEHDGNAVFADGFCNYGKIGRKADVWE